jgi:glucose uptake protein GlcU
MLGYILALLSSVFFSLYIIPRKLSKLSPLIFSFFMSIGFFIGTIVLYSFQPLLKFQEVPSLTLLWSVVAGAIWATAFVLFVSSIDYIGLSRSNQWKNLQGPVGVLLCLFILGETTTVHPQYAILAALAVFISAIFFTFSSNNKKMLLKGIVFATLSAIGFGTVATIQKYVTVNIGVYTQQVVWSISIALSLLIYILLTKKLKNIIKASKNDIGLGLIAGVLYLGASCLQLFSYKYLAASIGFTIIQMNAFWTIAIGIFIFKEIDLRKYSKNVILGFIFTLIGITFLIFAKR